MYVHVTAVRLDDTEAHFEDTYAEAVTWLGALNIEGFKYIQIIPQ